MANQTIDKPTLINRALVLHLGNPAKYSIDDESTLAAACNIGWEETISKCFALHDWTFARRTSQLVQLAAQPDNGWKYGFQLPGDRIGQPLKVLTNPRSEYSILRNFTIEGDNLYADHPQLWARCKVLVDPQYWDSAFTAAFVVALAGSLAIAVQQDEDLAATKYAEAFGTPAQGGTGGSFGRLIAQDLASEPKGSGLYWQDPLTAARWS